MRRRSLLIMFAPSYLIAACAGSPTPTALPIPTKGSPEPSPTASNTKAASLKDYVPSDPALVGTTGRMQLIVFFGFKLAESQQIRPYLHELQDEYGLLVDFVYLDIDASNTKAVQKQLTFSGSGTRIIFMDANGKELSRLVRVHAKAEIAEKLDQMVAVG